MINLLYLCRKEEKLVLMYNYFMLVGRIARDVEIKTLEDGRNVLNLLIVVQRPFRNAEGEYENDLLRVTLWESTAEIVSDNVRKGAMIGVKGRIVSNRKTKDDGTNVYQTELVGERIVFFSNIDTKVEG